MTPPLLAARCELVAAKGRTARRWSCYALRDTGLSDMGAIAMTLDQGFLVAGFLVTLAGVLLALVAHFANLRRVLLGVSFALMAVGVIVALVALLVPAPAAPSFAAGDNAGGAATSAGSSSSSPATTVPGISSTPSFSTSLPAQTTSASPSPTGSPVGVELLGPYAPEGSVGSHSMDVTGDGEDVRIGGHLTAYSIYAHCSIACRESEEDYALVNLGREYSTVKLWIGTADDSFDPTKVTRIQVLGLITGNRQTILWDKSYTGGESDAPTLQVSGIFQLKVIFGGPLGRIFPAIGDLVAYR
jgi:hypothetical protein